MCRGIDIQLAANTCLSLRRAPLRNGTSLANPSAGCNWRGRCSVRCSRVRCGVRSGPAGSPASRRWRRTARLGAVDREHQASRQV